MKDIQKLREQLLSNWRASPDYVFDAYSRILDHIFNQPCSNMKHMSFGSFYRIVNDEKINNETLINLIFHIINRAKLLEMNYEFIDDDESCYPLALEIIKEAKLSGLLYHPETGEPVSYYKDKVFMYFTPSKKLLDLKCDSF